MSSILFDYVNAELPMPDPTVFFRVDVEGVLDFIGKELGVTREEIIGGGRRREISTARSAFCYVCIRRLGLTGRQLSEALQVSPAGVHLASVRGEVFVKGKVEFEKSLESYLNNLSINRLFLTRGRFQITSGEGKDYSGVQTYYYYRCLTPQTFR